VYLAVQQVGDLLDVRFVRCRGGDRVNQAAACVHRVMCLHAEVPDGRRKAGLANSSTAPQACAQRSLFDLSILWMTWKEFDDDGAKNAAQCA
jgi:hypothetical protein